MNIKKIKEIIDRYKNILKVFFKWTNKKEDLYIRILVWAYKKQETGFTWDELKEYFLLNKTQEAWVRKIFLTVSDNDRKYIEHLRYIDTGVSDIHVYSLNEKGITAVLNYQGLKQAESGSSTALLVAALSLVLTSIGLYFSAKQINLAEQQGISERIIQAQKIQSAKEFCEQNPNSEESGLYEVESGKAASCYQVNKKYK